MSAEVSGAYFKRISFFWMAVITGSFGYFTLLMFWPQTIPYKSLGLWGNFSKYLVDKYHPHLYIGYWLAWLVHIAEALYSVKLCSDKGITSLSTRIKWAFQTFLFGITSLQLLLSYKPEQKKK
ncbi:transmembrane protein 254 [Pristis pectinata]|uniref:transmembrane protein 254 n=1 Tax=Pristis pectinata TaxID=685728 RepID=UPI00223DFCD2|nr:transmembrane protein 254 [Pristis pectinata]